MLAGHVVRLNKLAIRLVLTGVHLLVQTGRLVVVLALMGGDLFREAGCSVSEGRPVGTTRVAGCSVSEGRPVGTTRVAGCSVSEGRPVGTTGVAGCSVSEGRPRGKTRSVHFHLEIDFLQQWEHSPPCVNVDDHLLEVCSRRIAQQRTYDTKPLGTAVCYRCGHMLWTCVGGHTFLVNKPSGTSEDEAPASAYLRAVPNCTAGFVYTERGDSTKERWYCCAYCKSNEIPLDHHVGDVFDATMSDKPVHEWDMTLPTDLQALANQYERGQTSLCGLFSSTVKEASVSQYRHMPLQSLTDTTMVCLGS